MQTHNTNTPEQSAIPEDVLQKIIDEADVSFDEGPNDFKDNWIEGAKWAYLHLGNQLSVPESFEKWAEKEAIKLCMNYVRTVYGRAVYKFMNGNFFWLDSSGIWQPTEHAVEWLEEESLLPVPQEPKKKEITAVEAIEMAIMHFQDACKEDDPRFPLTYNEIELELYDVLETIDPSAKKGGQPSIEPDAPLNDQK